MVIIEINTVNYGSTGNIMHQIAELARLRGDKVITCVPDSRSCAMYKCLDEILFGNRWLRNISAICAKFTGLHEFLYVIETWSLLRQIKNIKPDLIHLHNLHGNYINLAMLFRYIKKHNIKVVWTLHDCWSFTGHCPYFDMSQCFKWRTDCFECPSHKEYPSCMVDDSKRMYSLKKKWFLGIKNMTLVAPSKWMENLIPQSFLKDYPVAQINNGIDIEVFYPTESDTRKKYKCKDKYIIIGVAFAWGERKGLDVFVELANRLDEKFQIVLVGTSQDVDAILPKNIISIHRTLNQNELVEIYTAADLFVNPTREELFGLVNVEALACGTPVLTFRSGGSPEVIDETCGVVVDKNDIDAMEKEVKRICFEKPFSIEACRKRALMFNKNNEFHSYVDLFHNLNILT